MLKQEMAAGLDLELRKFEGEPKVFDSSLEVAPEYIRVHAISVCVLHNRKPCAHG